MMLSVRELSIRFGCVAAVTKMHLDVGKRDIIG
jgi:ABC-type branched-subunit amino acid transport system ATPase component